MKRKDRIIWTFRIVITAFFIASILIFLGNEPVHIGIGIGIVCILTYFAVVEWSHWLVMKRIPAVENRLLLAESEVPRAKRPNRFWYWLLRDKVADLRNRETSDEET